MSLEGTLAVARLIAILKRVDGNKRLQKIVYLLQSKGCGEFDQEFSLHCFGPFSNQLNSQLGWLCYNEFIIEDSDETYVYKPINTEFDIILTEQEKPSWQSTADILNKQSTSFLEALSTIVYLHKTKYKKRLKREFLKIKPFLSNQFESAKTFAIDNGWIKIKE